VLLPVGASKLGDWCLLLVGASKPGDWFLLPFGAGKLGVDAPSSWWW